MQAGVVSQNGLFEHDSGLVLGGTVSIAALASFVSPSPRPHFFAVQIFELSARLRSRQLSEPRYARGNALIPERGEDEFAESQQPTRWYESPTDS